MGGAVVVGPETTDAQDKIGFVDTEYVLNNMAEYETVQDKLGDLEEKWRSEIKEKREEARTLKQEFEARELLYTEQERTRKQKAIKEARKEVEQLRQQYFGPDGELYSRQRELMRPLQKRILKATEEVATEAGYDYVVDRKGEKVFLYAAEENNLSDLVLRELGINVDSGSDENVDSRDDGNIDSGNDENPDPPRRDAGSGSDER